MPRHKDGDISKDGSLICFIKILYAKVIRAQYFLLMQWSDGFSARAIWMKGEGSFGQMSRWKWKPLVMKKMWVSRTI